MKTSIAGRDIPMRGFGFHILFSALAFMACLLFIPAVLNAEGTSDAQNESSESVSKPDLTDPCFKEELIGPAAVLPAEDRIEIAPQKRIIISLADQNMWVFENDEIVQRFPVSTGRPGHRTPTGDYNVRNRAPRAFSKKYECYMLQWMAITSDGEIGMHALEGRAYERHLGHVASHGCIRLSHVNAQWLYIWVEIGLPVEIVDDWEEPIEPPTEEEVLAEYPFHW